MLFAFEGTGMSGWLGNKGLNDMRNTSSFVWSFYQNSCDPTSVKEYFPGPNIQGSQCDDIVTRAQQYYLDNKELAKRLNAAPISIVGYSRGAYIAMCFALWLQRKGVTQLQFMGLFDPVGMDASMNVLEKTGKVPTNAYLKCFQVHRAPYIGSRNITMNYLGQKYRDGKTVTQLELPGSHAAMGGWPNEAGFADAPTPGQGDPNNPKAFHHYKELTAWWLAGDFISQHGMAKGALKNRLVGPRPRYLLPSSEWDTKTPIDYGKDGNRTRPSDPLPKTPY